MTLSLQDLYRFPLFAELDLEILKRFAMIGEIVTLDAGEWLFHEGDKADALYVVTDGLIDLKMAIDTHGTVLADLERLIDGDVLGWSALTRPGIYTLGAIAAKDARLLKLDATSVYELLVQYPESGFRLMYRLAQICRRRLTNMHVRFVSLVETESLPQPAS